MVLGLNKGGVTNAEGHFTIEQVPPASTCLQATAIGYKSVTTPNILSTKDLTFDRNGREPDRTRRSNVTALLSGAIWKVHHPRINDCRNRKSPELLGHFTYCSSYPEFPRLRYRND
jgi:hypothetical protein